MSMKIIAAVITAAIAFTAFEAPAFAKHRGVSLNANGGKGGNHNSGNNSGNGGNGGAILNAGKAKGGTRANANGGNGGNRNSGNNSGNGGAGGRISF
jgi:hypothetical protein